MTGGIRVNGEAHPLPAAARVLDLLAGLGVAGKRVAVELNGEIVPKSRYGTVELSPGDRIEIVAAVGGG